MTELTPPEDFDLRRARWITETQAALLRLMERHGMTPPDTDDLHTIETQTGHTPSDTTRIMIVGAGGDLERAAAAIRESDLARDVLIVGADVPIRRERDQATVMLRGYGRFAPVVLIDDALSGPDAYEMVRIPERPKQTKREWRQAMKGAR